MKLSQKLERGVPLRVLFINDLGFEFGAGIAALRQVQSFLLRGDSVMGLCATGSPMDEYYSLNQAGWPGEWLGFHRLPELGRKRVCSDTQAAKRLAAEAAGAYPDLIIAGNIHNARWPVSFLDALRSCGAPVRHVRPTGARPRRRAIGGLGRIRSRRSGRRSSSGCSRIPIRPPRP